MMITRTEFMELMGFISTSQSASTTNSTDADADTNCTKRTGTASNPPLMAFDVRSGLEVRLDCVDALDFADELNSRGQGYWEIAKEFISAQESLATDYCNSNEHVRFELLTKALERAEREAARRHKVVTEMEAQIESIKKALERERTSMPEDEFHRMELLHYGVIGMLETYAKELR